MSIESLDPDDTVISWIRGRILNQFASWVQPYFGVHTPLEEPWNIYQNGGCKQRDQAAMVWLKRVVYAQISDL